MSDLIDDALFVGDLLFQPDYGTAREAFVAFWKKRDETLAMPKLILPAIHLRARAGKLLERESNVRSKLKLPPRCPGQEGLAMSTISEMTPDEASGQLDHFRVIDVREARELEGPLGSIAGAENVPLGSIEHAAERLRDAQPLLLVCRSGKRSAVACERLRAAGIPDVTNLAGGMIAWQQARLAVCYDEPHSASVLVDRILDWIAQVGPLSREEVLAAVRALMPVEERSLRTPSRKTVERILEFADESLAAAAPPDLEMSLASFRRVLAGL